MNLHIVDVSIIVVYLIAMVIAGSYMNRRASKDLDAYFLGGKTIPWYYLSLSNAGGMFDVSGTMWLVYIMFVYGMKSVFIPWIWPLFNQIFMMVYLAIWLRRSNVLTGAEWITTRFDQDTTGGKLAHSVIVIFSIVSVIGFLSYGFVGVGKFAKIFLPWDWHPHVYAIIITLLTGIYVVNGGMFGVVVTDVMQYVLMTVASVIIAIIAMNQVTPEMIAAVTPKGWDNILFGWKLDLDWSGILDSVNDRIASDGYQLFTIFIMMALFKGLFVSMAGPVATQSLQRILASRNAKEAAIMNGFAALVVSVPRYLMVGGLTVLALVFFRPQLIAMGADIDFELILPLAIQNFVPVGLMGIMLAGMFSAHMSTTSSFLNLGPAYFVNDIYKKYFRPNASDKTLVRASYIVSAVVTVASILFGLMIESVDSATQWIVSALWAGSAASNVLKWHWWRFNGYGYFYGMLAGLLIALIMPVAFPDINGLYAYPYILLISGLGSVAGALLTKPENEKLLIKFYSSVRPWGFWEPIKNKVKEIDPSFEENKNFGRDMLNVAVGTVWQVAIMAAPLALVIKNWDTLFWMILIIIATTVALKKNWYDKLELN
ncbi:Na+/solute symporter [Melioribacter roseus P3M-2]|uniref:Na+/solute symporter n=1 Tax=Melioribacter roseus (strain DSM 23840 / JCM 17771 / VKM B-2668 / P3M-2) TaxID=1191523 RepID=I6YVF6_MELRP|nr:sodium:solute symporter family protein [Melioribacter roseus]AFN74532.1 Na+/solute symporter [Melioribacter roseus P3M-2]